MNSARYGQKSNNSIFWHFLLEIDYLIDCRLYVTIVPRSPGCQQFKNSKTRKCDFKTWNSEKVWHSSAKWTAKLSSSCEFTIEKCPDQQKFKKYLLRRFMIAEPRKIICLAKWIFGKIDKYSSQSQLEYCFSLKLLPILRQWEQDSRKNQWIFHKIEF